jgi:hypothetical protein
MTPNLVLHGKQLVLDFGVSSGMQDEMDDPETNA